MLQPFASKTDKDKRKKESMRGSLLRLSTSFPVSIAGFQVGTSSLGRNFAHFPISGEKLSQPTTSHSI